MVSVIYETKGRAREFAELAINLYNFCSHGCVYCYSPDVIHKNREVFSTGLYPRITAQDIVQSAKQWADKGETRRILLSFLCDVYQPIEQETQLTRKCIMALHEVGLNVTILTKGGLKSMRDFDLLTNKDAYATTLTLYNENDSLRWEPNAASPKERLTALESACWKGIETWVSLEPVIDPEQTKYLVGLTADITGHYKLGKLNYENQLPPELKEQISEINWHDFGWEMKSLFDRIHAKYYFKKDLLKEMRVNPTEFKQTWVCH